MKSYKFLFTILIFPFHLFAQNKSGPWPGKEYIILNNAIKNRVVLMAEILDRYGNDKVITEFLLSDSKADSVIEDEVHNEGDAFLYQPIKNGFTLTLIDEVPDEKGKLPSTFEQHQIIMINQKLKVKEKYILSGPIVNYLKRFKKYQKMK